MCKEKPRTITAFVLRSGFELLEAFVTHGGKVRLLLFRDTREDGQDWFQLEFLKPDGDWEVAFRVSEGSVQDAIELFTRARDFAKANPHQGTRE